MTGRTSVSIVALVAVLSISACSGSSHAAPSAGSPSTRASTTTRATTTTTTIKVFSSAKLQSLLLTTQEIPPGYAVSPPSTDDSTDTKICGKVSSVELTAGAGSASVSFQASTLGPFLIEGLGSESTTAAAKRLVSDFRKVVDTCPSFDDPQGTATTHWTLSELSFPRVGDDSIAVQMNGTQTGGTITLDLVVARVRNQLVVTAGASLLTILGGAPLPADHLLTFTTNAVNKLQASK